jgi:hypothetical protein
MQKSECRMQNEDKAKPNDLLLISVCILTSAFILV